MFTKSSGVAGRQPTTPQFANTAEVMRIPCKKNLIVAHIQKSGRVAGPQPLPFAYHQSRNAAVVDEDSLLNLMRA